MTFTEMINQDKLVLVDFFAEWCGPCQTMAPLLEELKQKVGDRASIVKVDVDKNPKVASVYKVQGVPTLILFRNGEILWRTAGLLPLSELQKVIEKYS